MNLLLSLEELANPMIEILGKTLLPGLLLVLLVQVLLLLFRRLNASSRHLVWLFTLAALALLPLFGLVTPTPAALTSRTGDPEIAQPIYLPQLPTNTDQPFESIGTENSTAGAIKPQPVRESGPEPITIVPRVDAEATPSGTGGSPWAIELPAAWAINLFLVWLLGSLILLARLSWGFLRLHFLKQTSLPLDPASGLNITSLFENSGARRIVQVCTSPEITTPLLAGLVSPMILIPESLVKNLSASELNQIVLHELAHVKRRDDWVKLFERVIQSLFFFHPAVWWISKNLDFECEVACDDWVMSVNRVNWRVYTACLLNLAGKIQAKRRPVFTTGLPMARTQIERRIKMLMNQTRIRSHDVLKAKTFAISLVTLLSTFLLSQIAPEVAVSQQPNSSSLANSVMASDELKETVKQAVQSAASSNPTRYVLEESATPIELEIQLPVDKIVYFTFQNGVLYINSPDLTYVIVNHPASYQISDGQLIAQVTIPPGQLRIQFSGGGLSSPPQIGEPISLHCELPILSFGSEGLHIVGSLAPYAVDSATGEEQLVEGCQFLQTEKLVIRPFEID